ncbi:MAG: hypothetical protein GXO81_03040 [Chlorobi bacterium]|nr:hypothetical protein [Chlorobiota bacterium]
MAQDVKSFLGNAITHLAGLTRLDIHTLVGDYEFNKDKEGTPTTLKVDSTDERMCSQVNLITGDITTAMTNKFANEYKDLREYHLIRENQGHEIIKRNIEVLEKILETLKVFQTEQNKSGTPPNE